MKLRDWIIGLVVIIAFVVIMVPTLSRSRGAGGGHTVLIEPALELRKIIQATEAYSAEFRAYPSTYYEFVALGYLNFIPGFSKPYSQHEIEDFSYALMPLTDIRDQRVPLKGLQDYAAENPPGSWERFGTVWVSRDFPAGSPLIPDSILACTVIWIDSKPMACWGFGDGHVSVTRGRQETHEVFKNDRAARAERDLPRIPQHIVDEMLSAF